MANSRFAPQSHRNFTTTKPPPPAAVRRRVSPMLSDALRSAPESHKCSVVLAISVGVGMNLSPSFPDPIASPAHRHRAQRRPAGHRRRQISLPPRALPTPKITHLDQISNVMGTITTYLQKKQRDLGARRDLQRPSWPSRPRATSPSPRCRQLRPSRITS